MELLDFVNIEIIKTKGEKEGSGGIQLSVEIDGDKAPSIVADFLATGLAIENLCKELSATIIDIEAHTKKKQALTYVVMAIGVMNSTNSMLRGMLGSMKLHTDDGAFSEETVKLGIETFSGIAEIAADQALALCDSALLALTGLPIEQIRDAPNPLALLDPMIAKRRTAITADISNGK